MIDPTPQEEKEQGKKKKHLLTETFLMCTLYSYLI